MKLTLITVLLSILFASESSFSGLNKEPLAVVQDGKYGYIDHDGNIVIRPQYIWADDFWQGMGVAYVCGRFVSVNSSGALLPRKAAARGRLEPARKAERVGFIDASGEYKIAPVFDDALPFSSGFAAVRTQGKWGFIDMMGRETIRPQYHAAFYFREGVATAWLANSPKDPEVLIDTSGKIIARGYAFSMGIVAEGRVPARRDGKSGYLDLDGNEAIPFIYDQISTFSEGMAAVQIGAKWGYIDLHGKIAIPSKFEVAGPFANGLAPAKLRNESGFIDRSGNFSIKLQFRYSPGFIARDDDNFLTAPSDVARFWTEDDKFGVINISGKVIWGPAKESPDHSPLFLTDEFEKQSCDGFSEETKRRLSAYP